MAEVMAKSIQNPDYTIDEMIRQTKKPRRWCVRAMQEVSTEQIGFREELKTLKTNEIIGLADSKISMLFEYLDDVAMSKLSAAQLVYAIGILIDKRQLLSGEPTQIYGVKDIRKLSELGAALQLEGSKRAPLTVEGESERI